MKIDREQLESKAFTTAHLIARVAASVLCKFVEFGDLVIGGERELRRREFRRRGWVREDFDVES